MMRIQAAALGAFRAVGGRDYARVDVMVRQNGEPVVLEVNTLPGMTETSLLPKAAAAAGLASQPLVSVTGGAHATIMRQLMNEGVDSAGRRSRFGLGVKPN